MTKHLRQISIGVMAIGLAISAALATSSSGTLISDEQALSSITGAACGTYSWTSCSTTACDSGDAYHTGTANECELDSDLDCSSDGECGQCKRTKVCADPGG